MSDTDLTFLELQAEALHDDFNAIKYRARCKGFLNDWLGEIFRTTRLADADQEATITTVSEQREYDLPATSIRVETLRDTFTNPDVFLSELSQDDFDGLPHETGVHPVYYVLHRRQLWLWPTPAAERDLELRFRGDAVDLVDDEDKPAIPNNYRRILVHHARAELFALEDDWEANAFWAGKRDVGTSALRADLQRRSRRVRRVPSMWHGRRMPGRPFPRS